MRIVCPVAYERLALDRLRAVVRSSNAASLRILERAGFSVQSRMRRSDRRPGSAGVEMVYTRDRDERWYSSMPQPRSPVSSSS